MNATYYIMPMHVLDILLDFEDWVNNRKPHVPPSQEECFTWLSKYEGLQAPDTAVIALYMSSRVRRMLKSFANAN